MDLNQSCFVEKQIFRLIRDTNTYPLGLNIAEFCKISWSHAGKARWELVDWKRSLSAEQVGKNTVMRINLRD